MNDRYIARWLYYNYIITKSHNFILTLNKTPKTFVYKIHQKSILCAVPLRYRALLSYAHFLPGCFLDDLFHDLTNNFFEEHLKECLRNVLSKIMTKIHVRNTAEVIHRRGIFGTPTVLLSSCAILLSYIIQKI